jgi:hypothetical protein
MAETAPAVLAAATAIAALGLLGACADQTKLRESELTQLLALLPGRYDNTPQAELDARSGVHPAHESIALIIAHVYTPRLGHHLFYAQEMAADDPRRVMSQKMYSFEVDEKRGIVETVYRFVEPLRWRNGQQNAELFTSVVAEDVQAEGCQLLWKKSGERFIAMHDPGVCPDPVGAAPQAELGAGVLSIGDYKFRKTR